MQGRSTLENQESKPRETEAFRNYLQEKLKLLETLEKERDSCECGCRWQLYQ